MKRKRRAIRIIFLCCLIVSVPVGAELLMKLVENRVYQKIRCPHLEKHHGLAPLKESPDMTWGERKVYYAVNSFGMRDKEPRVLPRSVPSTFRILFLGDSFVEGVGISYEDSVTNQAELLLDKRSEDRTFACLNGGVASYSPLLEYFHLAEFLRRGLKFDYVVLFVDPSDPQDEIYYRQYLRKDLSPEDSGENEPAVRFHSKLFAALYSYSAVFRQAWRFRKRLEMRSTTLWREGYYEDRNVWTEDEELIQRWGEEGLNATMTSLSRIASLLRRKDIPFTFVIYPWPLQIQSRRNPCILEAKIVRFCEDNKISLLNLFPIFRKTSDWEQMFVPGDVHWNESGHRFVAEKVADFLKDREKL